MVKLLLSESFSKPKNLGRTLAKTLCFLALNLVSIFSLQAQVTIPAGNTAGPFLGNDINGKPLRNYFGYERSAAIYTGTEIGQAGNITSIGFYLESTNSPAASTPINIYFKQTTNTALTSSNYATEKAGSTLVFSGTVTSSQLIPGTFITFTLTSPYSYSNTSNLEVIVETNGGGAGIEGPDAKLFRFSAGPAGSFEFWQQDDIAPENDPSLQGVVISSRPNVQFSFGTAPQTCDAPTNLNASNITTTSASLNFTPSGSGAAGTYTLEYGPTGFTVGTGTIVTGLTGSPYNVTNLSPNTGYQFYVRKNCGGNGTSGNVGPAGFTTAANTCAAPTAVSGAGTGQTTAQVTFSGGGTATSYLIEYGPTSTFPSGTTTTTVSGSPANLTGLTAGTNYTFVVRTNCTNGVTSGNSPQGTFTTSPLNCDPPTNLNASNITATSAQLNFTPSTTGAGGSYTVEYGPSGFTPGTGTIATGITGSSFTASNLAPSTSYQFYVQKNCTNNTSSTVAGPAGFITAAAPVQSCDPATNLTATNITQNSATLSFTGSTTGETGTYIVQYGPVGFTNGNGTTVSGPPYNVTGLSPATTYDFTVQKICTNSNSTIVRSSFKTLNAPTCAAPITVSGTGTGQTTAQVTFSGGDAGASYVVEYGPTSTFPSGTTTTTVSGSPANLSGLTAGTNYTFVVRTNCTNGVTSGNSPQGTFNTSPLNCDPPINLNASNITATSAQLNFTPSTTGAGGSYTVIYEETSGANPVTVANVTGSSITASNLTPSTNYRFTVQKNCTNNTSSTVAGPVNFTTAAAPVQSCDPATNLTATNITQNSATLNFDPSTTGASSTSYVVQYGPAGFPNGGGTTVSGPPYNISGLTPATTYDFTVQNDCGASTSTIVRSSFTTSNAPTCDAPTTFTVNNITFTSAEIAFSGGSTGTSYSVQYGPTATFPSGTTTVSTTTSPVTINNLNPATNYSFVIRTVCSATATSSNSATGTFATQSCDPATGLTASNITTNSATLGFTGSTTGATGTYVVQYGLTGFPDGSGTTVSGPPYNVSGLTPNTSYDFTVQKNCGGASSTISRLQFRTRSVPQSCLEPTTVNGTPTGNTTAQITFSGGDSAPSYDIEYGPSSSFPAGTSIVSSNGSPTNLTGLTPNTAYTFVVRANCSNGVTSPNSQQGTFTTASTPPSCVAGTWLGTTSANWHTAANWCGNQVPTAGTDVTIPAGTPFSPEISANATTHDLTINSGATLTISNGLLTVTGVYTNNGTFNDSGKGSLAFTSNDLQQIGKPNNVVTFLDLTSGPGGINLNGPVRVKRLLTLSGNLTTNAQSFILQADPSTQSMVINNPGIVVGTATMQRYINPSINAGPGYRHLSSPVAATTLNDLNDPGVNLVVNPAYNTNPTPGTTTPFPTIYRYNETRLTASGHTDFTYGWESPASLNEVMLPGEGFTVNMIPTTIDFNGLLNNGAVVRGPLTRGNTAKSGWHLLGNPYPSPIDWDLVTVPAGIDNAVYVARSSGQYSGTYVSYVNGVGPTGTELIAAMQGFFVRVNSGTPTFTFNNSNRVTTYQNPALYRQAETRPLLALSLQNGTGLADQTFVYFQNGATSGFDGQFDAYKLPNTGNVPALYSLAGSESLSINGLPLAATTTVVPLGGRVSQAGTWTFQADQLINFQPNQTIYLEDIATSTLHNLNLQPTYQFSTTQTDLSGRFFLRFGPASISGISKAEMAAGLIVYPNPSHGQFIISLPAGKNPEVAATLFNAVGQQVWNKNLKANGPLITETVSTQKLPSGVYTLRLETSAGPIQRKIVIE